MINDPSLLPRAKQTLVAASPATGSIISVDCEAIGTACVILGGGREKKEDSVDPSESHCTGKVGDAVKSGEPLCTIYQNSESRALRAKQLIEESYRITEAHAASPQLLVRREIGGQK